MSRPAPKSKTSIFVKAAIVTFALFCVVTVIDQQFRLNELHRQEAALREQILNEDYVIDGLKEDYAEPFDDEYVKTIARRKLGYHMPEEILFFNNMIK